MPPITLMNLRAVRSEEGALSLLGLLGYDTATVKPYDLTEVGWDGVGRRLGAASPRRGYGVLVATIPELPRSLRGFGRHLVDMFHDQPLALVGLGEPDRWREWVLIRPRLVRGGGGTVTITKLQVDPAVPTAHDVEVLGRIAWQAGRADSANQEAVDRALDVDRVTRQFFVGLNGHYQKILAAVREQAHREPATLAGVESAGGVERVALRIVTQTLFCYFLQRKGLLEGDHAWLSHAFERHRQDDGAFYPQVMEPLFYEALNTPVARRPQRWRRDRIPFLNGGLFERRYGRVSLQLADELFSTDDGLIGFLDGWSFTVSEDTADETEVAVDPEMLGKVFEHLVSEEDRQAQGTVYTPRPAVQFMSREALIPYLRRAAEIDEAAARMLLTATDPFREITGLQEAAAATRVARLLDPALAAIQVLDPAVGSGAFLLGMLSEILRLRRLAHEALHGVEPTDDLLGDWKLHAIEHCLFGVDINPMAIELCRLRLWLSLLVEAPVGASPRPLPNLEHRTVCANSLTDFVAGEEVQDTRDGVASLGFDFLDADRLIGLRERYFEAFDPDVKAGLRTDLTAVEDEMIATVFARARTQAAHAARAGVASTRRAGEASLEGLGRLEEQFHGADRVYPTFLPAFHAPEAVARGGWDVVIMNPPYVGRKEVAGRLDAREIADLERHYGRTYDSMILFGLRALQFARSGGALSMIFNDSLFTSTDAEDFRVRLTDASTVSLRTTARTRCFEGVAITGGVIVATRAAADDSPVRWVENHGRPPADLLAASEAARMNGKPVMVGTSELFQADARQYRRLPHRPLFRPSRPALAVLDVFERCAGWEDFGRLHANGGPDWMMLSATRRLDRWKEGAHAAGWYERLRPGRDFVLLGLVADGGQGLATADDRRFTAAIAGTPEAQDALGRQARLEELTLRHPKAGPIYEAALADSGSREVALLEAADRFHPLKDLGWPRGGEIRIAPGNMVRRTRLTDDEVREGVRDGSTWVPFEKPDDSSPAGAAAWRRENPLVIDWSPEAVTLLRRRAGQNQSYRKPRIQNEHLWGRPGVTFNSTASYLRARMTPDSGIFGHKTPVIAPQVDWLSVHALLALLNAPILDFILRTFLGSRMQIEIGDVRRLPIPVLTPDQADTLDAFGQQAITAKEKLDAGGAGEDLTTIEADLDLFVRDLYGVPAKADLWVVR